MSLPLVITLLATFSLIAFWSGWDLAVERQRARAKQLRAEYRQLLAQTEQVLEILNDNPAAAALDTGKLYAVGRMRETLTALEEERPS